MTNCFLSILFSLLCLSPSARKLSINEYDDFLGMKPERTYVLKKDIDLNGNHIVIPSGCELVFYGGSISNGRVYFSKTKIKGKGVIFRNIKVDGTVYNDRLYAKWFVDSTASNDDFLIDVIKLSCESNASFIFEDREYHFFKPIFIYGRCNLVGTGKTIIRSYDNGQKIFILAGNTAVKGKPITWEGKIRGINFVAQTGDYNYFLGLLNVNGCVVSDCSFDMSRKGVNCYNKVIASVNNANFSNPSKGSNIAIIRNIIRLQDVDENRNNGECIGIENRNNVLIEGNIIFNTRDDLGIHNSESVVVRNNKVFAYDGRIYVSNSKNVEITGNSISYVFPSTTGMGVFVGVEQGYDQIPEHIVIKNNVIDYTKASDTPCYGIRIMGAKYVDILDNVIKGNPTARIAIEIVAAKASQREGLLTEGMLVPQHIRIEGNETNGLWFAGYANYKVKGLKVLNNTIRKEVVITNPGIVFKGNIMNESITRSVPTKHLNRYKKMQEI